VKEAESTSRPPVSEAAPKTRGGWLNQHFQWRNFLDKQIPSRKTISPRSPWDYLGYTGTMALALLIIQFGSGFFLLLYYVPDPEKAFASLQMIRNDVPFGMLYSNLHSISAKLLVLILLVHMFRIMFISAHRGPRKTQWYIGVLLLAFILLACFSGYLLPWSQQSYWASVIGTEAVRAIPLIGHGLVLLIRGGESVTGATLHRFFALHVTLLPICIMVLAWLHIKRVWKRGVIAPADMSARVNEDECTSCWKCLPECRFNALTMIGSKERQLPTVNKSLCNACRACAMVCPQQCISFSSDRGDLPTESVFPDNLIHRLTGVMAVLIILFFCVFFLHGLLMREKVPADPLFTPQVIKPEWYFLAAYEVLRKIPSKEMGLIILVAVSLLVFFLPAIDRSGPRNPRRRPIYIFLVIAGIISFIILTIAGYF
jgi:ubiquinol-cytochrome c reductase cytochrome b subunit